jgi:hypothetical protein
MKGTILLGACAIMAGILKFRKKVGRPAER